jgi:hypothetical protein
LSGRVLTLPLPQRTMRCNVGRLDLSRAQLGRTPLVYEYW